MQLVAWGCQGEGVPQQQKYDANDNCEDPNCPVFGFDEDFDETVHKSRYPKEPFEEGC